MTNEETYAYSASIQAHRNVAIVTLLAGGAAFASTEVLAGIGGQDQVCAQTAQLAYVACGNDVLGNYQTAMARCLNVTDPAEKEACLGEAGSASREGKARCREVRRARLEVCGELTIGTGPYDPPIDPGNFLPADQITGNVYFPLSVGTKWVYKNTDGETITVTVTDQTAEIRGIPVRVVTDVVVDGDGKTTENTKDWYAQDLAGNVWYMGESTLATNPDNMLASVQGSWETGVDGAKPGIIMPAVFIMGDLYRREWSLGDAEDVAENLSKTETQSSPAASCSGNCLKTRELSPLDPDRSESKFHAPNVGVIVTLDDQDPPFREELVEFTSP